MAKTKRRRSAVSVGITVARVLLILLGIGLLGAWIVDSIGGEIRIRYVVIAIGLFVASYLISYLG